MLTFAPRTARVADAGLAVLLAASLTACGDDDPPAPVGVASVAVTAPATPVDVGGTATFTAVVTGTDGRPLTGQPVTWRSDDATIATVNEQGVVRGMAVGATRISATAAGVSGGAPVTVRQVVTQVLINLGGQVPVVGVGVSFTATAVPLDRLGATVPGRTATWTTETPAVLTVTPAGVVTTRAAGIGVLTATVDGIVGQTGIAVQ